MQHETTNAGRSSIDSVSVAIPAVMRAGGDGKLFINNFNCQMSLKQLFQVVLKL